jgi:hypothetical protein
MALTWKPGIVIGFQMRHLELFRQGISQGCRTATGGTCDQNMMGHRCVATYFLIVSTRISRRGYLAYQSALLSDIGM